MMVVGNIQILRWTKDEKILECRETIKYTLKEARTPPTPRCGAEQREAEHR